MEKQEKQNIQYNRIKRKARTIPFGYKIDDTGDYLIPIESELKALEEAKNYLKTCSLREVAIWLTRKTGRYISYVGLNKRVKRDTSSEAKENNQEKQSMNQQRMSTLTMFYQTFCQENFKERSWRELTEQEAQDLGLTDKP